ncbi:hypothetical protein [Klebsiella variicola]|uniref:hypothetical protein n=1 Tax=Klebsiella variicola TaxID=244366 RepID=UPI0011C80B2E|nr:hypothetical protein [Klebsiella variicola]
MELGNLADVVSAACNGVVAYTAIAALTKAKDYFKNKLTEEDIALWLQINDGVSSIASTVTVVWVLYDRMINEWQETDDHQILKYHYLNFLRHVSTFTEQLHKLDEYQHRLSLRTTTYLKHNHLTSLITELNNFNRVLTVKTQDIITVLKWSTRSNDFPEKVKLNFIANATKNLSNPLILNYELQNTYDILREFGIDDHHINSLFNKSSENN